MSIRNFEKLFAPKSVALVGASGRQESVGSVIARNLRRADFAGEVLLVNPHRHVIEGVSVYPDLASLPGPVDLAVIATPPDTVPGLVAELGARGTPAAVIITAGFSELGERGRALQQATLDAARPYLLRLVGPNCLGIMVPGIGLDASFSHLAPPSGHIAFVSQSGAMITAMLDWAAPRRIGFSHVVSLGDMADVDFGDMLDYLGTDPQTRAILLYAEGVTHGRKFMSAARAAARVKPVLVLKAGRFEAGARAASSHTGMLAGSDRVCQAAFRRAGMLSVGSMEELFDTAVALPPLNPLLARAQMMETRVWRLLQAYRGRPAAAIGAMADVLVHLGEIAAEHPEIRELDLNRCSPTQPACSRSTLASASLRRRRQGRRGSRLRLTRGSSRVPRACATARRSRCARSGRKTSRCCTIWRRT